MNKSRYYLEKLFYHRTRKQWNLIFPNLSISNEHILPEQFVSSYIIVLDNDHKISVKTKLALKKQIDKSKKENHQIKFIAIIPDEKKIILTVEQQFDKIVTKSISNI